MREDYMFDELYGFVTICVTPGTCSTMREDYMFDELYGFVTICVARNVDLLVLRFTCFAKLVCEQICLRPLGAAS
jgi:hypothetical protein